MGIKLYFLLSALLGNNLLKDSCAKMGSLSARKKKGHTTYIIILCYLVTLLVEVLPPNF